jgi:hypothetical protein
MTLFPVSNLKNRGISLINIRILCGMKGEDFNATCRRID